MDHKEETIDLTQREDTQLFSSYLNSKKRKLAKVEFNILEKLIEKMKLLSFDMQQVFDSYMPKKLNNDILDEKVFFKDIDDLTETINNSEFMYEIKDKIINLLFEGEYYQIDTKDKSNLKDILKINNLIEKNVNSFDKKIANFRLHTLSIPNINLAYLIIHFESFNVAYTKYYESVNDFIVATKKI